MTDPRGGLTSWRGDWAGLRVAVLGLEATTFSVVDTLAELGADVVVIDADPPEELARLVPVTGARLAADESLDAFQPDVVVPSTELPRRDPRILRAVELGLPLWSDVEVAWRVRDKVPRDDGSAADWILVCGSEGADDVTHHAAAMLVAAGRRAAPCGGSVPVLDAVRDPAGFDVLVVEVSARQLALIAESAAAGQPVPHSAACVSAADIGDAWHASDDARRDALAVVYRHARVACVYSTHDERTMAMVEDADVTEGARAIGVGLGVPGPSELGVVDGILADRAFVENRRTSAAELATIDRLAERGIDTPRAVASVLAAAALARAHGAEPADVARALAS